MDTDFQLSGAPVILRPIAATDAVRLLETARQSTAEVFPWLP